MAESLKEKLARLKAEREGASNGNTPVSNATSIQPTEQKIEKEEAAPSTVATSNVSNMLDSLIEAVEKEVASSSLDDLLDQPLGTVNKQIAEEAAIAVADIIPRIRQLQSLSDMEVEAEMPLLKNALMANPEAVSLMLPTDVGELVVALRRITKEAVVTAEAKKKPAKAKKVDISNYSEVDDF